MSPEALKQRCLRFLSTHLRRADNQPEEVAANLKKDIQGLIDGTVPPEDLILRSSGNFGGKTPAHDLISFLKDGLPYLRHSLFMKEVTLEGINPPPPTVHMLISTPRPPTVHMLISTIPLSQDGTVPPKDFTSKLPEGLKTPPHDLKKSCLRSSLIKKKVKFEGENSPPPKTHTLPINTPPLSQKRCLSPSLIKKKVKIEGENPPSPTARTSPISTTSLSQGLKVDSSGVVTRNSGTPPPMDNITLRIERFASGLFGINMPKRVSGNAQQKLRESKQDTEANDAKSSLSKKIEKSATKRNMSDTSTLPTKKVKESSVTYSEAEESNVMDCEEASALKMAIIGTRFPGQELMEIDVNKITQLVLKKVDESMENGDLPRLDDFSIVNGSLIYCCGDEFTCEWLVQLLSGHKLGKGLELKVIPEKDLKPVKVSFETKDVHTKEAYKLLSRLKAYNNGFKTEQWRVLENSVKVFSQKWIFMVDKESAEAIVAANFRANTGIDKGTFRILAAPKASDIMQRDTLVNQNPSTSTSATSTSQDPSMEFGLEDILAVGGGQGAPMNSILIECDSD